MGLFGLEVEFDPLGAVQDTINGLFSTLESLKRWLTESISGVWDYLKNLYAVVAERFDDVIKTVEGLVDRLHEMVNDLIDGAVSTITGMFDTLGEGVTSLIADVGALPGKVRDIVHGLIDGARRTIEETISAAEAALFTAISAVADNVRDIKEALTNPEKFGELLLKGLVAVW